MVELSEVLKRSYSTGDGYSDRGRPFYIVDGYNVILRWKGNLEENRDYFLKLLDSYASKKKVEITVVWDGSGNPGAGSGGRRRINTIYSAPFRRADDKIIRMVQRMKHRGRVTVVSDDKRHIVGVVKQLGAGSLSVEGFLDLIGFQGKGKKGGDFDQGSEEEPPPADDLTVEQWLELFRSRQKR
jgi:predicted RNA-binding protein with PIN domain